MNFYNICYLIAYATTENCSYILDQNYICNVPSYSPSILPSNIPTFAPSNIPSIEPTYEPTYIPTFIPSYTPTIYPSFQPSLSLSPSYFPTFQPTYVPSYIPTYKPTYVLIVHKEYIIYILCGVCFFLCIIICVLSYKLYETQPISPRSFQMNVIPL